MSDDFDAARDMDRANLFLNHGRAKHSDSCWRCDETWPCLTMRVVIDADHEWAQWHDKWIATLDLMGSQANRADIAEAKVREQAEEIERLKQEAKRVVAVAEAAPKQSYVIDLGEIAKQDAPKQAEQPDHEELREVRGELHKTYALMRTYKERNIECAGGHDGLGCGLECEVADLRAKLTALTTENERLHKNIDINLELLEKAEAELAAERANTWRLAGEVVERDQLLAAEQRGRAAERAHRERLEKLLLDIADDATDGPINCGLNSVQAVLEWREALRPAAHAFVPGRGTQSDDAQNCGICGDEAEGHPAAPEPTPSVKRCDCPVHDCQHHRGLIPYPAAGSEQPDLPLGHEFVAGHPHPAYQSYCALRGIFGLCGQPESVHQRKP